MKTQGTRERPLAQAAGRQARRRGQSGMAAVVALAFAFTAVVFVFACTRLLHTYQQELRLVEKQQVARWSQASGADARTAEQK
jgi:hypothetical protein